MSSPLFLGVHGATIDAEGRIQLPSALRDEVNVRQPEFALMATWEADGSLCLRLKSAFEAWIDGLRARPAKDQAARRTLLTVAAHSAPVKCDKQGRIRVPDALLGLVGIDRGQKAGREVLLVGDFESLRLFHPDAWDAFAEAARGQLGAGLDAIQVAAEAPAAPMGDAAGPSGSDR